MNDLPKFGDADQMDALADSSRFGRPVLHIALRRKLLDLARSDPRASNSIARKPLIQPSDVGGASTLQEEQQAIESKTDGEAARPGSATIKAEVMSRMFAKQEANNSTKEPLEDVIARKETTTKGVPKDVPKDAVVLIGRYKMKWRTESTVLAKGSREARDRKAQRAESKLENDIKQESLKSAVKEGKDPGEVSSKRARSRRVFQRP